MNTQIRITKTQEIEESLQLLKERKFPTLDDSEIVKYLIGQAILEIKDQFDYLQLAKNSKFFVEDRNEKINYNPSTLKPLSK